MSNDLALLNQAPDYLKEVGIDNMTKALSGNTSVKRISGGERDASMVRYRGLPLVRGRAR